MGVSNQNNPPWRGGGGMGIFWHYIYTFFVTFFLVDISSKLNDQIMQNSKLIVPSLCRFHTRLLHAAREM